MTNVDHQQVVGGFADVLRTHEWERLGDYMTEDAIVRISAVGRAFSRPQQHPRPIRELPNLGPGTTLLEEVIGGATYALTPTYTSSTVNGSGNRGTAINRVLTPTAAVGMR